ncbi:MAG: MucB/RseB C-terminal domain-containing protein [Methylococcaceae bacterium]|nr:MucB/RseB C-terminal domain-containing protein [Methylococcaceae bacterium]
MSNFIPRLITLWFLAVFSPWAVSVEGDAEARTLLLNAKQAMSQLNYRGIISYMKDNRMESLNILHGVAQGVEQERVLSLNTPMRELVRTAETVTCYYPETKSMSVDRRPARHSFLFQLPVDLDDLGKYYSFSLGAVEYIARRQARQVIIEPKDDMRFGRRLWIDLESKLPLKFELLDENKQVIEQMVFNSLSIEQMIPPGELSPSTSVDGSWKIKQYEVLPTDSLNWSLDGVPEGFRMMSYTRLKRGQENRAIDHILLSDGISSVSIYIDQLMNEVFTAQPRRFGAINSYTRKLDGYRVTVMGEAPAKTVQSIGNGIHWQDSPQR